MSESENVALTVQDAIALGARHQNSGRPAEAEAVYQAVLRAVPNQPVASHNLGLIALQSGRVGEAVALLQAAVQAHPEQAEFHNSLGAALIAAGRPQEAEGALLRAVQLRPTYVKAIQSLVAHGSREAARTALAAYLAADPEDAIGAAVQLAALGAADAPARASDAHLLQFYGARASSWEDGKGYRHAHLVADQLVASLPPGRSVLDAGCGTGLVGLRVRSHVSRLSGVDLSPAMLARARDLGVYDELETGDLVDFLCSRPSAFDGVASAATLIHFGELSMFLSVAAKALRPGGVLVFTAFPDDQNPDAFSAGSLDGRAQAGTFRHGREYLKDAALRAGFRGIELRDEHVERHPGSGAPVTGVLATCTLA